MQLRQLICLSAAVLLGCIGSTHCVKPDLGQVVRELLGPQRCARECLERSCDSVMIQYGKYCGVTHTGCPGEQPCDAADACCQKHDSCVKNALEDHKCHSEFIACLDKVVADGKQGFSKQCHIRDVSMVMKKGINLVRMLGGDATLKGGWADEL